MLKILAQVPCSSCNGKAYIATREKTFITIFKYVRRSPCPQCNGSGKQIRWIDLNEFLQKLDELKGNEYPANIKQHHASNQ